MAGERWFASGVTDAPAPCQFPGSSGSVLIWNQEGFPDENGRKAILPWCGGSPLFSLRDMRIFLAQQLVSISNQIITIFPHTTGETGEPVPQEERTLIKKSLEAMWNPLDALELKFTQLSVKRFAESAQAGMTYGEAEAAFDDLDGRFQDEIESIKFFYVSPDKMKYFDQQSAFGVDVFTRFPSAEYDIKEAANCFALSRSTATVMHCMRVLEVGLDSLASALKVSRSTRGWGADLRIFSQTWEKQLKAKPKLRGWKRTFFPEAFSDFRYFADAWRNYSMHGKAQYGEEEARKVFEHVKGFMQHLATRLGQVKTKQP